MSTAAPHAVEHELGSTYIPIDEIASPGEVIAALDILERMHGVGRFIDVISTNNCSVRLRTESEKWNFNEK